MVYDLNTVSFIYSFVPKYLSGDYFQEKVREKSKYIVILFYLDLKIFKGDKDYIED